MPEKRKAELIDSQTTQPEQPTTDAGPQTAMPPGITGASQRKPGVKKAATRRSRRIQEINAKNKRKECNNDKNEEETTPDDLVPDSIPEPDPDSTILERVPDPSHSPSVLFNEPNTPTHVEHASSSLSSPSLVEPPPRTDCLTTDCDVRAAERRADDWDSGVLHRQLYMSTHRTDFGEISRNIGTLAMTYFPPKSLVPDRSLWKLLDDGMRQKLKEITPQAAKFIDGERKESEAIFKAYMWRVLYARLFTARDKWSTEDWASFGRVHALHDNFDWESRFAHPYRHGMFYMARILYVQYGPHVEQSWLTRILREAIQPFLDLWGYDEEAEAAEYAHKTYLPPSLRGLGGIIDDLAQYAIKADFAMVSSPLHMKMDLKDPDTGHLCGFTFREDEMRGLNGEWPRHYEGYIVDFIVTPMLRTYGPTEPLPEYDEQIPLYFASNVDGFIKCWRFL
ncbi:unnamed protein product [Clonostachys rosea]|uniref:Uncharacterized protein n=1 Tax=Bionectria ochroleuca TaxID=29856 RepID=A0ABY6UFK8_BIOOC|nr:unnamed protein product [Clonostachys rosea]